MPRGIAGKRIDGITEATGCSVDKDGSIRIYDILHPKVKPGSMIREAHLVVEAKIGKHLPKAVCVFHWDRDVRNYKNLVVCQDNKYMQLLKQRRIAYENCGNPKYRKCCYCGEYDDPTNMVKHTQRAFRHRYCNKKTKSGEG